MRKKNRSKGYDEEPALPEPGVIVHTACGGQMKFESETPTAVFDGRRLYFCLPACRETFIADPASSCLADAS